ncbi:MAG: PIN domain-containing protein [Candidatus Diapherotrites archaeon]
MTDSKLFLDSSIWLGYFLGAFPESRELVDSEKNSLFTSVISLHEVFKKLKKLGKTEGAANQAINFIEENSIIITLNKKIVLTAAVNCERYGLHTIDSMIYSSAAEVNALFVTADNDFKKCPRAKIIEA